MRKKRLKNKSPQNSQNIKITALLTGRGGSRLKDKNVLRVLKKGKLPSPASLAEGIRKNAKANRNTGKAIAEVFFINEEV